MARLLYSNRLLILVGSSILLVVDSFSASGGIGIGLDRFTASCPADPSYIRRFEASLIDDDIDASKPKPKDIWVAVYRSNQNQPSVFVRDEFFHAMNAATSGKSGDDSSDGDEDGGDASSLPTISSSSSDGSLSGGTGIGSNSDQNNILSLLETPPMAMEKPVAVARLRASPDFPDAWVLDSLRCSLKKESMDESCDGGSEFLEALSVAVDSLVLHHLQRQQQQQKESDSKKNNEGDDGDDESLFFEGVIRTKATLFSNRLLEDRGFAPVEELSRDMATHISSLDGCLDSYAQRSVDTTLCGGTRDRALQIVSLLGQLDRPPTNDEDEKDEDDEEEYDPWANIKMQL